jgi:hypothetical protein
MFNRIGGSIRKSPLLRNAPCCSAKAVRAFFDVAGTRGKKCPTPLYGILSLLPRERIALSESTFLALSQSYPSWVDVFPRDHLPSVVSKAADRR